MTVQGRDPNYRQGDFVNVYPHSIVISTDLPSGFFSNSEGKYWLIANRNIAIGTFLGINSKEEVEAFMAKLETKGLNMFVEADCPISEIMSGTAANKASELVVTADKLARGTDSKIINHRIVTMICNDAFKKTSLILFSWFFYANEPAESQEGRHGVSPSPKRSWKFWK